MLALVPIIIFFALLCFLIKDTFLAYFISLELIVLANNLNFVFNSLLTGVYYGIYFSIILLAIAAVDTAIGLAIMLKYHNRSHRNLPENILMLKLKN